MDGILTHTPRGTARAKPSCDGRGDSLSAPPSSQSMRMHYPGPREKGVFHVRATGREQDANRLAHAAWGDEARDRIPVGGAVRREGLPRHVLELGPDAGCG